MSALVEICGVQIDMNWYVRRELAPFKLDLARQSESKGGMEQSLRASNSWSTNGVVLEIVQGRVVLRIQKLGVYRVVLSGN